MNKSLIGPAVALVCALGSVESRGNLEQEFRDPPDGAKVWCYWWWLNGAASPAGITRDFEEMKRQGIAGALLFDAGEAGAEAPRGPRFMSPEWRELFKHAVREADRLGLTLGVNLCSGWDAGGPWVTDEHAAKKLVASHTVVKGPGRVSVALPRPDGTNGFYRDIAVLAHPYPGDEHSSVPATESERPTRAAAEVASSLGGETWVRGHTVDLTRLLDAEGRLTWDAPGGAWSVLRIGYTLHNNPVKCVGSGPGGPEIDPMSAAAMDAHFAETGAKLIADAGPLAGKSLRYFHIDSWELGQPTWTPNLREEFKRRRGYDALFYLPALLGHTVDDAEITQRFLADYRRTAADLVAANYYGRLRELTRAGGLQGTHPESGGPFFEHWIDGLQCEGINDIPMGEFWKRNSEPTGPIAWPPQTNPTIKQIASAAHIYGKPVCQAEAFTSFADDWIDDPWTMKDIGDEAFCHGLTRNVLCFYVHQPRLDAKPGFQWAHVGTHFDRNLTWWDLSGAWLTYLARCQHLLRQRRFVADFAYFQGEDIPGFIAPRDQQKPARPGGFDYDVLNAEALLGRAAAENGRLTMPDGMSYRYLVLPERSPLALSPAVLRKIKELTESGVTLIGPKPDRAHGLQDFPACDEQVKSLADTLWGRERLAAGERQAGSGRVLWGSSLSEIVRADGALPDVEFRQTDATSAKFDWIHRRDGEADIYFLSNQASLPIAAEIVLRVTGKQPELWDAVTGEIRDLPVWREEAGRTVVPLEFAPRQSFFIVLRKAGASGDSGAATNFPAAKPWTELSGPWEVAFDPKWGGPEKIVFERLEDWSNRHEDGIRYYSGTAIYRKRFELPSDAVTGRLFLSLGTVHNLARVKVNGRDQGVVWTAPWQAEITAAARAGVNDLEIEVVNLWPNRLIGDATLAPDKRFTITNVRTYDSMSSGTYGCKICEARKQSGEPASLLASGLLGPVTVLRQE